MDYVVCGFYTPDYRCWWDALRPTLERHGASHDFVEVSKRAGGWERNTMCKAHEVMRAMKRHPAKTIVFLDVDCEVRAPLDELVASVHADVAIHLRVKRRRSGEVKWGACRSGTLVLRPTVGAAAFVDKWIAESDASPPGSVDQDAAMFAIINERACSFQSLPGTYCAVRTDRLERPVIFHSSASATTMKVTALQRRLRFLQWRWKARWDRLVGNCSCTSPRWVPDAHGDSVCRQCGSRAD
jgi:hypothetical protein